MSSLIRAHSVDNIKVKGSKKRHLSDSEETDDEIVDTEGPTDEGQGKRRDGKDKKRRRRKKRKLSIVYRESEQATPEKRQKPLSTGSSRSRSVSTASERPVRKTTLPRRSLRVDRPLSAEPATLVAVPVAGPSHARTPDVEEQKADSTAPPIKFTATDKGKTRMSPRVTPTPPLQPSASPEVSSSELAAKQETLIAAFHQSMTCQVCLDLMYKPYALAPCGHTVCHDCLVSWFTAPPADIPPAHVPPATRRKKSCPHCRARITERPVEVWAIKHMVQALAKSGLVPLPAPPPPQSGTINDDPWTGIFLKAGAHDWSVPELTGLRDDEDGVYRCVDCHHEIWNGVCSHCHREYLDADEDDDPDFDLWALDDGWRQPDHLLPTDVPLSVFAGVGSESDLSEDDLDVIGLPPQVARISAWSEDEEDEEHIDGDSDSYEGSFIDDADVAGRHFRAWRAFEVNRLGIHPIERYDSPDEDGDEDEELDDPEPVRGHRFRHLQTYNYIEDDEEDPSDEPAVVTVSRTRNVQRSRHRGAVVSSDEEDTDVDNVSMTHPAPRLMHRPRIVHSVDDELEEDQGREDLAAVVAARERELYGDDGSIPRNETRTFHSSLVPAEFEEDDELDDSVRVYRRRSDSIAATRYSSEGDDDLDSEPW